MTKSTALSLLAVLAILFSHQAPQACVVGGDGGDPQTILKNFDVVSHRDSGADTSDTKNPEKGGDGSDPR